MAKTMSLQRIADRMSELAAEPGVAMDWCAEAESLIQAAVPFDAACWQSIDPVTLLMSEHWSRQLPNPDRPRFAGIAHNEYLVDDVNRFADLALVRRPVASLHQATNARPQLSPRYREMLRPNGFGPELRAAFVHGGACWGSVILIREYGRAEFTASDLDLLARVAPYLGRILRQRALPPEAAVSGAGSGVVLINDDGVPDLRTGAASRWLAMLPGDPPDVLAAIAAAAHADGTASLCTRATDGTWVALEGAVLEADPRRRVSVIVGPAQPMTLAPRLMAAFGLSPREQDIARLVLAGRSTAEIGKALFITPYTVKDHLKVIFDKAGVRSRRELSARLFYQHRPDLRP
jgi:DNA-binding CsgD family transcriptional regulator